MTTRLPLLVLLAGCASPAMPPADTPPDPAEAKAYYALPEGAVCRLGDLDGRHPHATTVHFPADGKTFFTGGAGGVREWDAATLKLRRQYPEESYTGWPLVATPDGRYLVAKGSNDVRVLSRADGKPVHTLGGGSQVWCFALSPDGKTVATGTWEGEVLLWDVETGKRRDFVVSHPPVKPAPQPFRVPPPPKAPAISHVAFSPDGTVIASSGQGDVVRGWDVKTAKALWAFDNATTGGAQFAFAPDGKTLAIPTRPPGGAGGYFVGLWRLSDGTRPIDLEDAPVGSYCIAFSPDGRYFAAGNMDMKVRVWDARTGKFKFAVPIAHSVSEVQFSRDGKTLVCVSMGLTLWDVETGKEKSARTGHAGTIQALAVIADGTTAFTAGAEGSVRAWDVSTGKERWVSPLPAGGDWPYAMVLAPDGKELAVASIRGAVRVLDPATGRELRKMPGVANQVFALTYSPDGKTLAALGPNLTAVLWDAATGKTKAEFVGYDGYGGGRGSPLRFTPDGKALVASVWRGPGGGGVPGPDGQIPKLKFDRNAGPGSDEDGKVRLVLWEVPSAMPEGGIATGKRLRVLGAPTDHGYMDAVFNADGSLLFARDDKEIAVIDVATGKEQRRFAAEWGTLLLAPDGKLWAGAVCYDPATGKKVSEVAGGKNCFAAQSADGRVLVTVGGGGSAALVWKLPGR